jgi:cardiolipin synthase
MVQARHLPNLITALRFLLVLPLTGLLVNGQYASALVLFAMMGVSDAVDGFLAKRFHWQSRLGEYLDPLADKTMLVSAYLTLGWLGLLPGWLVAAVIVRDLVIVSGALAYHFVTRRLEMRPTLISKVNTVAQIALAVAVIADQFLTMTNLIMEGLVLIVLATTLISGLHYVLVWSRLTRAARRP